MVFALPDFNSVTRRPISAFHAASTSSSTLPPRFEIRESASASCSSTDSDKAFSNNLETSGVICAISTSFCNFTPDGLVPQVRVLSLDANLGRRWELANKNGPPFGDPFLNDQRLTTNDGFSNPPKPS